ncbi:two-partner secretion domain-containing protein [Yokenella regensburgei]|uniref:two-partner secretion domain-containing protein n=1 Tax=Yokenella regensburgei TaxID=158877 RepID=UPI003F5CF952
MNKNLYRIVFNKARGMLMVVADIARSGRAGSARASGIGHTHSRLVCKLSAMSLSLWLAMGVIQTAQANIVADVNAAKNQQPTVLQSANGTPQVNIQTPSGAGVSRNNYTQFDVNQQGVILNNSHKNVQTQLGGMVAGNPWLAKGEAKVILNEVTARDPSKLNGMIEVAGQKAQVVIANPAGITCNGCGFINANRATLTTGQAQLNNGNLTGYNVERGEVVVEGAGMDTTGADYTDIIARSVKVNAGLWANDLKVTTGRNSVNAAHDQVTKGADEASTRPQLAVDVSSLGGMYAGKIRMIGTETGVGVRNAGAMGAQAGSVTLTADGRIENSGTVRGSEDAILQTAGEFRNSGIVTAGNNVQAHAATLTSDSNSVLAAGVGNDGKLGSAGELQLSTDGQLNAHGQTLAGGTVAISGQGVDLSGSQTQGKRMLLNANSGDLSTRQARVNASELSASTAGTASNDGGNLSADTLNLSARHLSNQKGTIVQSGKGTLTVALPGKLDNQQGQIASNGDLNVTAQALNNNGGQLLGVEGNTRLNTGSLDNTAGLISATGGDNIIQSRDAVNNTGGRIEAARTQRLEATGLNNQNGVIVARGASLALQNGDFNNQSGSLLSQGTLDIQSGDLNNQSGFLASNGALTFSGGDVDNRLGQFGTDDTLNAHFGTLTNQQGALTAGTGMTLDGESLNNDNGGLIHSGGALDARVATLTNQQGALKAGTGMTLDGESLNNDNGGLIQSGGALDARVATLTNQQGALKASTGMTLRGESLNNDSGGLIQSGGALDARVATLTNQQGALKAGTGMTLDGESLNNDGGGLIQSGGALDVRAQRISNRNSGDTGGILSLGETSLNADALDNSNGVAYSGNAMTLRGQTLDNTAGQLVANEGLTLNPALTLNNQSGLIQAKGIQATTGVLNNVDGTLNSLGELNLAADTLDNQAGTLAATGNAVIAAARLTNRDGGRVIGEGQTTIKTDSLANNNGQIQSVGDLMVESAKGVVDNTAGLIRSGNDLSLDAATLTNQNTLTDNKGLEGQRVSLKTTTLDNQRGSLLANEALEIQNTGELNNSGGALAATGVLEVSGETLSLINRDGTLKAGKTLKVDADRLDGSGQLLSLGDMTLHSAQAFDNSGSTIANGTLDLTTQGDLTNSGKLLAGKALNVQSDNLTNTQDGEINAGRNTLTTTGTLLNRGLIDGGYTRINVDTLTNIGSGRIYGDAIGVNATTFSNLAENGTAATLAGRERVDLGVNTLNNRDHGLIYSAGEMEIGGTLDDKGAVTGQAATINNHSSTIESAGDMAINAGQINNINDRFSTEIVTVSQEPLTEYQHSGSTNRWKAGTENVLVDGNSSDGLRNLSTPERPGGGHDNFNQYDYTRTVEETRIKESDPAKILAGGNLTLSGDTLNNDKSQVIAGGTLSTDGLKSLRNEDVTGERRTTDVGTVTHYYRIRHKGDDEQGRDRTNYTPPTAIQSIKLKPGQLISNGTVDGSNLTLSPLVSQATHVTIARTADVATGQTEVPVAPPQQSVSPDEPVTPPAGQQFEVKPAGGLIRIVGPNTRLPDNSLFKVNPAADVPFLVETDPRFTNERNWLGSDYMQKAFSDDGDNTQKRLGDGYYEQRLVREQVIGVTGQRYLDGYSNDEEQYKSLMDRGITFGKQYDLKLGVALTPEQMALLTGDIVWLVNTRVKMPDGSMQTVLVPQVYAKVKQGDIDGSGALIAGNNVSLKLNGSLFNNGTISGRRVLQLDADNITNQAGTIRGADVNLLARTDITNNGGTVVGENSVVANAGRDITLTTTTASAESVNGENRFSRTTIDSVSGIYVQGEDGKLALQSGRDITLRGAQVIASGENGKAQLVAGRDLTLDTVTTARSDNLIWDADNTLRQSSLEHNGTTVNGNGGVTLAAGNDIAAYGAAVKSDGTLALLARNDIKVSGVLNENQLDERHKVTGGNGWLSKTTRTTRDTIDRQSVQGSELSANMLKIDAGNNVTVAGSSVVGTGNVGVRAGNDLTLTTMGGRNEETHLKQEKKSGLLSSGGIGFTVGSRKETTEQASQALSGQGSMVGSLQGDTVLLAGNDYRQTGSTVASPEGNVGIQGKNVTIEADENTYASQYKRTLEQKGFTLAVNVPVVQAVRGAIQSTQNVGKSNDDRINMLAAANAAWDSARAASAMMNMSQGLMENGAQAAAQNVSVSLTYGQSKQTNTENTNSTSALASKVNAGQNAVVVATGGKQSDINIIGSDVSGKQSTTLFADNDINIVAAQQERHERSDNKSSGWNAGVAVSYGQGGASFGVTAGANKGKGYGNGDERSWRNSHVGDMDGQTTLTSGGTTTLRGGQLLGKGVDITAQDLNIESLQDTMQYDGKQMNVGGQVTVGYGFAASGNYGQSKVNADYASVQEQSGVFAGADGYNINVKDNTDLVGGLITSSESAEQAGKNQFSTGTISWRDVHNNADYEGNGFGVGGSMSMNTDMGLGKNAAPQSSKTVTDKDGNTHLADGYASLDRDITFGIGHDSGSENSVTRSGINTSNVTVTRPDAQQQAVDGIKTDITTETAAANSGRLEHNFDKDKVLKELNLQVQVTRDFKENANRQIGVLLDDKQAAARNELQKAIKSGDVAKRDAALDEIYKIQYQRRLLQTVVGIVAGSPDAAITQGTLVLAATKLREETARNSMLSPGVVDKSTGNVLSNISAVSGAYDGLKLGGVRVGLDIICGSNNERCDTKKDANGKLVLDYDAEGRVKYKGDINHPTLTSLLEDKEIAAGLYGYTGGLQGVEGLFGDTPYAPGTLKGDFFDTTVESFAGSHDFIGGQLPGFYDETGNTSRNRSDFTKVAAEVWTYAALPQAAPFALSEVVSPELLEFIFATNK